MSVFTSSALLTVFSPSLTPVPFVGVRLGILFQPICQSVAKYHIILLELDPILRDYIFLSQTSPIEIPPLPPSTASWSATNIKNPYSLENIDLSVILPDSEESVSCQTTQYGADLFLGVKSPEEFNISLSLSGIVLGSIYVDYPTFLPPPLPVINNIPVDGSFLPGFQYPPEFLWPSQVNTFYPWYYIMYNGDPLPPLEMIPYIPTVLK